MTYRLWLLLLANTLPCTLTAMEERNLLEGVPIHNYYQPFKVLTALALTMQSMATFQRVFPSSACYPELAECPTRSVYLMIDGASLVFNIVTFGLFLKFLQRILPR